MAVPGGLGAILVDKDREENLVGSPRDIFHRAALFKPSHLYEVTKLPSESPGGEEFNVAFYDKDSEEVISFTSKHLRQFTNNFNVNNRIGSTQFGEVYRGKIELGRISTSVVVKIWDERADVLEDSHVPNIYVNEEVRFLKDKAIASHPNIVKVIGKCCEEKLRGIVYDLDPLDTLHIMMMKDNLNWDQRVMVALKFAQLLKFLHCQEKPYVVLGLDPLHVMLDNMLNPILFDFGLLSGGIIGELSSTKRHCVPPHGYADPQYLMGDGLHPRVDVYAYGVILIGMIAKRVVEKEDLLRRVPSLDDWAQEEYKPGTSLVHKTLESEWGYNSSDAASITELAMRCMKPFGADRPTMTEVVCSLKQLQVVKDLIHAFKDLQIPRDAQRIK